MTDLFGNDEGVKKQDDWKDHWKEMPEYNNVEATPPFITATFKFRNQADFNMFNALLRKYLYDGEKVFDGMQRKDVKSTWFPLNEKANKYVYK